MDCSLNPVVARRVAARPVVPVLIFDPPRTTVLACALYASVSLHLADAIVSDLQSGLQCDLQSATVQARLGAPEQARLLG